MWGGRKSFCICTAAVRRVCKGVREWKSRDKMVLDTGAAVRGVW